MRSVLALLASLSVTMAEAHIAPSLLPTLGVSTGSTDMDLHLAKMSARPAFNNAARGGRTTAGSSTSSALPTVTRTAPVRSAPSARASFQSTAARGATRTQFNRASTPRKATTATKASGAVGHKQSRATPRATFNRTARRGTLRQSFRHHAGYPDAVRGTIRTRTLKKGETLYRAHSGAVSGRYASPNKPTSTKSARSSLALPKSNRATQMSKYVARGGERVKESVVAAANGRPGGGRQSFFLDAKPGFKPAGWLKGGLSANFGRHNRSPMQHFLR